MGNYVRRIRCADLLPKVIVKAMLDEGAAPTFLVGEQGWSARKGTVLSTAQGNPTLSRHVEEIHFVRHVPRTCRSRRHVVSYSAAARPLSSASFSFSQASNRSSAGLDTVGAAGGLT